MKTATHRHADRLMSQPADLLWHLLREHDYEGLDQNPHAFSGLAVAHENLHAVDSAYELLAELAHGGL